MHKAPIRPFAFVLAITLISGCATTLGPPQSASENPAVVALVGSAHSSLESENYPAATASLERALRIEPKNPVLWQELALVHLRGGNYQQSESFASRSNTWANGDRSLLAANWLIISESRAKRGDSAGAQAALERSKQFEQ